MPELPDLEYIRDRLSAVLLLPATGAIVETKVKEPIVIRNLSGRRFEDALSGQRPVAIERIGPFLKFVFGEWWLVIHAMLAGRFELGKTIARRALCFGLRFESGDWLSSSDDRKMGKVYLLPPDQAGRVPDLDHSGLPVLGAQFNSAAFLQRLASRKQQVRAFLMDHSNLSAIGNAYADEILFVAGIHPKTLCPQLDQDERLRLFAAIQSTLAAGIAAVQQAGRPIEEKVRDHMQVRNRKDQPCPRCGARIRRANVLGFDAFFCPQCQPEKRAGFIDWRKTEAARKDDSRFTEEGVD